MTRDFDIVVIGASFAGLVCARTAAMRGLKVAVLDAKEDPGARVHTTGIIVKEAAEELELPHNLVRRVHGVRMYAPNLKSIDLCAPGYYFLTTDTANVLRWMASEAERAGAEIFCKTRFEDAAREGDFITLKNPNFRTRFLVGADGGRSDVAKAFGLDRNQRFLTGLEVEYEGLDKVDPDFLHCFIDSDYAPGYLAWAAPGPKVTQVGLAVGPGCKPDLGKFLNKTEPLFAYSSAKVHERRSGLIPCGGVLKNFATERVLLIGDAAGLVSPMTAGGIRLAFRSGRRAAHTISDYLFDLGPSPETVLAREMPSFTLKKLLRRGLDLAPPNWMLNAGLSTPFMRVLAERVYFHKRAARNAGFEQFRQERLKRRREDRA
ncbi:MAG: NAD(P)/FAD-dependent oxidoreductase [Hyphomicrobiales bacterium]